MENLPAQILPWNIYKKIALRFAFIFFILFIVLLDWSVNPVFEYFYYEGNLAGFLDGVISWVGNNLFHISYLMISPYDGQHNDRTYIYLLYFTMAAIAVIGTIAWSVLDRKRINYETLYYWLTVIIRYYLAFTLFLFALEKFFKMQFPDLGLYTLTEPVGNLTPMSLAWAFFGYSYGYNIFIGIAESAALLLLFRRTMIVGALLTLGTLLNVMVVNFNYDVHAKIYPTALFVMTFFLLLPFLNRLFKFFFTHQATSLPPIQAPVFIKRWMQISKSVVKFLFIGFSLIFLVKNYFGYKQRNDDREISKAQSGISGVFDVKSFVVDKDTLSSENPLRWNQIVIGGKRERIRLQGDSIAYMFVSVESKEILMFPSQKHLSINEQLIFSEYGYDESTYIKVDSILIARQVLSPFQFEMSDSTVLKLSGKIKNDSVFITAKRRLLEIKDFRLMKNGFHWVTE
jgi:hypothetical protein